jgi:hypothetical protein
VRYGWHLVTNFRKANQGNKSHKDVEAILIRSTREPSPSSRSLQRSLHSISSKASLHSKIADTERSEPRALNSSTQKQLVKIAIAIVAVALTPSEGAENHAVNKALLSQQVANHLRGQTSAYDKKPWTPLGIHVLGPYTTSS